MTLHCIKPTKGDIEQVAEQCRVIAFTGATEYPTCTYEEGVLAAIEWLTNNGTNPLEDTLINPYEI